MSAKYILTITYNFDGNYVCKAFDSKEEALDELNRMLLEEVKTVCDESEYKPTVIMDTVYDITLIYKDNAELFDENGNRTGFDMAFYKVMKIEN